MSTQGPGAVNSDSVAQTQRQIAQLKKQSRNSNFSFSATNNRFYQETSAGNAYRAKMPQATDSSHLGQVPNMRIANFQVGFERSTDYGTTTDQNNRLAASRPQA